MPSPDLDLNSLRTYAAARQALLREIDACASCRDPLAEFSEYVVVRLLNARLAESRVQKGYDAISESGRRIQVKYLSNLSDRWINEHTIIFPPEADDYALVVFESFELRAVLTFPREALAAVGRLLGKRHPHQERTLQLTNRNFRDILAKREAFETVGVGVYQPAAIVPATDH